MNCDAHETIFSLADDATRFGFSHIDTLCNYIDGADDQEDGFLAHWSNLALDQNFKSYTTRHRRILRYFYTHPGAFVLNSDSMYQPKTTYDVNYQHGANQLSYATQEFIQEPLTQEIIRLDLQIIEPIMEENREYSIDLNLFRVSAEAGKTSPTTSGVHQDGEDWLFMHFIGSNNIQPVISSVYSENDVASVIFEGAMNNFLETIIVNDRTHYHAAGPVLQLSKPMLAYRDLLLVSVSKIN